MLVQKLHHQVVGNVGLYYGCYRLSLRGWNVMPTARNARGVDLLIYSQDARRTAAIQIKALSKKTPVPLGGSLGKIFGDWFVVCRGVAAEKPECFVMTPEEVCALAHHGLKDGVSSYWSQPPKYENPAFLEAWDRIGSGL